MHSNKEHQGINYLQNARNDTLDFKPRFRRKHCHTKKNWKDDRFIEGF